MIIRVNCGSCGAAAMVNARAAYIGVRCKSCGSLVRTKASPAAPNKGPWKFAAWGGLGVVLLAGLTWGLVVTFSGGGGGGGGSPGDDGPPWQDRDPARERQEALQLARSHAYSIVQENYGGGETISTELIGNPYYNSATGYWSIPVKFSWEGKWTGLIADVGNITDSDGSSSGLPHSVQGDLIASLAARGYQSWTLRPGGMSAGLQSWQKTKELGSTVRDEFDKLTGE